jgi:DNA-binding response OmpR family regulator
MTPIEMPPPSAIRLLVVDDEASVRDMLVFSLSAKGYQVDAAATANEALAKAKNDPYNLMLIDLKMPDMDGLELLRIVKRYTSDVVAIIMTGCPDLQTTIESMRAGVFDYIAKPFDLETILNSIEKALENQRTTRELTSVREMNRLQSELLLHMCHEFKSSIQEIQGQNEKLSELVNSILDLPKRSSGRLPSLPMDWESVLQKLAQLDKPKSKATVLVVDDDPAVIDLLEYMLTRNGYQVDSAQDGQVAMERLKTKRPDFLIMDLMMPKLNGFEVLDALNADPALKDLPVVVLTARYLTSGDKAKLQKRVEGIVQKGETDIQEVVAILNEHAVSFRSLSHDLKV